MQPLKMLVIGDWHLKIITRSGKNLLDVMRNWDLAKEVFSIYDLAEWEYITKNFKLPTETRNFVLDDLEKLYESSIHKDTSFNRTVLELSANRDTVTAVDARLLQPSGCNNVMDSYGFVLLEDLLLIVIKDGFYALNNDKQAKETFIEKWLKTLYTREPIFKVATYPVFRCYLEKFSF